MFIIVKNEAAMHIRHHPGRFKSALFHQGIVFLLSQVAQVIPGAITHHVGSR